MTEQSAPGTGRENRSSWAWLIFDGPVALLILIFGVYFIVAQRDEWSARASEFQGECSKQVNLENASVELRAVNLRLRAGLPRLAEHPHAYPAPSIAADEAYVAYGCSPGEDRPTPAMPSASLNDLFAALIAPPRTD
ncbi:MAG: hypothetical protein K2P70_20195 [Hyphomonadaceae bacterium]|nr:hypothetical protein [Hyphomonadaceae bacterium]